MNKTKLLQAALGLSALVGVSMAWANEPKANFTVIKGSVSSQDSSGKWQQCDKLSEGHWVRASKNATLGAGGMTVRLEPGAGVKFTQGAGGMQLAARGGKICVRLTPGSNCLVSTKAKSYQASQGEFILDAGDSEGMYLLEGDARALDGSIPQPAPSPKTMKFKNLIALDGPDVRKRNNKRRRFTQGEENKGKRIGEDLPPTQTPAATSSPVYSPSPAYTPPVTPSVAPSTAPPDNPPPQVAGGGEIWPWIVIPAVLGGGIAAIVINNDDNNDVIRPISP